MKGRGPECTRAQRWELEVHKLNTNRWRLKAAVLRRVTQSIETFQRVGLSSMVIREPALQTGRTTGG